jgi:hypothetical protein
VKCDEEKPSCQRCTSTGRKCDGYAPLGSIPSCSTSPNASLNPSNIGRTLALSVCRDEKQQRSFHFFQQRTATQLSGLYGENFWDCLILRASHHEPAIRHAVTALGSLHEQFETNEGLVVKAERNHFAITEYNLAIRCLLEPFQRGERQTIDVCLMACVLFACYEVSFSVKTYLDVSIQIYKTEEKLINFRQCNATTP